MTLLSNTLKLTLRKYSTGKLWQEVSIPVPWGEVRGKWWGPTNLRPVLTLHGWQDNCGSFDRLIPLLDTNKVGFLAIDLPGHGYSSRLPNGFYYNNSTYLLTVKFIQKHFNWAKVSLMGHSLGGLISYVYTMLYPNIVDLLICLDGAKPMINPQGVSMMAKNYDMFLKQNEYVYSDKEPPSYTLEEMKQLVHQPNKGSISLETTPYILHRNIAPSKLYKDKYYFTRDPRLKCGNSSLFSQDEYLAHAQNMTGPMFIAKYKQGSYYEVKENFYEVLDVLKRSSTDCDFNYFEGTHHGHLNNPETIAEMLQRFIQRHNIENRCNNGISPKIVNNNNTQSYLFQ
ncbi:unnamed protein product [Ceutorhynchus assimilis]|uniref:AB hydrolase-1 domain-containing protein n=1 Tax=Ceutorhynchus assimilis TaxID=467358 RepID=A0A9N9MJ73_9CUCU|nr:unnamed protein product [Ceutorhynchus assimilis]